MDQFWLIGLSLLRGMFLHDTEKMSNLLHNNTTHPHANHIMSLNQFNN